MWYGLKYNLGNFLRSNSFFCEFLTKSYTSYTICCTWFIWKFFLNRSKCFQSEKFNENISRWNQNFSCRHTEFFFIKIIRLNHQFQIHTQVLQPCSLKNNFFSIQGLWQIWQNISAQTVFSFEFYFPPETCQQERLKLKSSINCRKIWMRLQVYLLYGVIHKCRHPLRGRGDLPKGDITLLHKPF